MAVPRLQMQDNPMLNVNIQRIGWIRLGIVISILWLLAIAGYVTYDYYSVQLALSQPKSFVEPNTKEWIVVAQQSVLTECKTGHGLIICGLHWRHLALLAILPILAAWLVTTLISAAFLWVRAGFGEK